MKLFLMLFLIVTFSMQSMATQLKNGGRTVGNGGDVIECQDNSDQHPLMEILDIYEAREIRGLQIDLGPVNASIDFKLNMLLDRLKLFSPKRAELYQEYIQTFFAETKWLTDGTLVDVKDSDHIAIPKNCRILQIANQSTPILPTDKRYIIDLNLWNRLNNTQKAALIFHEVIYREALILGHVNSVSVRILNGIISSKEIESLTLEEVTRILKDLDFKTNYINNVHVDLNDYRFYPNTSQLEFAQTIPHSIFKYEENFISVIDKIFFYSNGRPARLTLDKKQNLYFHETIFPLLPFQLTFYENGNLQSVILDHPINLKENNYDLFITGSAYFYPNGFLKKGLVESGTIFHSSFKNDQIPVTDAIRFYPNGNPEQVYCPKNYEFKNFPKASEYWIGEILFNELGYPQKALLNNYTEFTIQNKSVSVLPFEKITFNANFTKIQSFKLAKNVYLYNQKNELRRFDAQTIIQLDENERVIQK